MANAPTPKAAPAPIPNPTGPWAVVMATGPLDDINTQLPFVADGFADRNSARAWIDTNYPTEGSAGLARAYELKPIDPGTPPVNPGLPTP